MPNLTLEQAQGILGSRKMITEDGKYRLKVTNVTPYLRPDGTMVKITNFAAMIAHHVAEARKSIAEGDYDSACNQGLSASPRADRDFCPQKGEIVDVIVETITTKNGVTGQFVTSITPVATTVAKNVNVASLFAAEVEEEVEAEASDIVAG